MKRIKRVNNQFDQENLTSQVTHNQSAQYRSVKQSVDVLLHTAFEMKASDIHLEPLPDQLRIRYRVDGVLYDQVWLNISYKQELISRLKVLAGLDIAQHRLAQDGKFCVVWDRSMKECYYEQTVVDNALHVLIDLRVATFPSLYGEKLVVRILNRSAQPLSLDLLGLSSQMHQSLRTILERPQGLFLVTGPVGSGKTTTLYACVNALNTSERSIVTMEDPIEYNLKGITQSQVNLQAGFTFQHGLRSLLRQDPDIMMVGEIRDSITVRIAIEAALTGHGIFSTLHTHDALGAITRLLDMGVEPFLINASLTCVIAQRLIRLLCSFCKQRFTPHETEKEWLERYGIPSHTPFFSPSGCIKCSYRGYKGRTGIFEILILTDDFRELITKKSSWRSMVTVAQQRGMRFLLHDALEKVEHGLISLHDCMKFLL